MLERAAVGDPGGSAGCRNADHTLGHWYIRAKGTIRLVPSGISRQSGYSMERWLWTISGYLRFEGTELRKLEQKEETRQRDKQLRIP